MPQNQLPDLMLRHLLQVFGEKDAIARRAAIRDLYTEDCVCLDYKAEVIGHSALDEKIDALHRKFPSYVFTPAAAAQDHHDAARLHWHFGPPQSPPAITGLDIAFFENGRIRRLYVFLDNIPAV